jgi:hypothetical protein
MGCGEFFGDTIAEFLALFDKVENHALIILSDELYFGSNQPFSVAGSALLNVFTYLALVTNFQSTITSLGSC